eukprot:81048-Pyramimonas_sp.AAC.1
MESAALCVRRDFWVPSSLGLTGTSHSTVARIISVNIVSFHGGNVHYCIMGDVRHLSTSSS